MQTLRITPMDVFERMNRGERVLFIDSRAPDAWEASDRKLPGAIRVAPDDVDVTIGSLPHGAAIVVYCTCPCERSSLRAATRLHALGFVETYALEGGFAAWEDAGLPSEMKSGASSASPSAP